jgi:hypothetical protein
MALYDRIWAIDEIWPVRSSTVVAPELARTV